MLACALHALITGLPRCHCSAFQGSGSGFGIIVGGIACVSYCHGSRGGSCGGLQLLLHSCCMVTTLHTWLSGFSTQIRSQHSSNTHSKRFLTRQCCCGPAVGPEMLACDVCKQVPQQPQKHEAVRCCAA